MARSPLTDTYKRVQGMVFYVQENLSEDDYLLFLDMVVPEPEPEAPAQKTRKKRDKSARAQSLSSAIAKTPKADTEPDEAAERAQEIIGNGALCIAKIPGLDVVCDSAKSYPIHDPNGGYGGYHEFVSAVPAGKKRRKEAHTLSVKSEDEAIAVGVG